MSYSQDRTQDEGRSLGDGRAADTQPPLPRFVDWFVPGVLVLVGTAFVAGGVALLLSADPALVAEAVERGTIQSDVLSGAELAAVTVALARWGGAGLLATGVAGWLGAGWFVSHRRRERAALDGDGDADRSLATDAFVGGVGALALSFVPLSPVLGGAIAGYLRNGTRDASLRAGGLAGALTAVPLVLVFGLVAVGLALARPSPGGLFLAAVFVVALVFPTLFVVALGALGGFVGGELGGRSSRAEHGSEPEPEPDPTRE